MKNKVIIKIFILALMAAFFPASVYANELQTLTVKEAVKYAMDRSSELKTLDENAYLNEQSRDTLQNAVIQSITEAQFINSRVSVMQNELRQAVLEDNMTLQKIMIEFSITRYFSSILAAERDLALYDGGLEMSLKNLEIAGVRTDFGQMSRNAFETMQFNYEKDAANREIKTISIDNAYRALNYVMGTDLDAKYALVLEMEFKPLSEINLTRYIRESIDKNIGIKNKESDLALLTYRLGLTDDRDVAEELEISIIQANRAIEDAKASLEDKIIACYKELLNMESQYDIFIKDCAEMQKQLAVKETQLSLGRLAQTEIDNHIWQITQLNYRILGIASDHFIKKIQFENPDLL